MFFLGGTMVKLKNLSLGIAAAVTVLGPVLALAHRRYKSAAAMRLLLQAKADGRKQPHAPKPRKARRIARHLARNLASEV
jgi:hypothetical protein